MKIKSVEISGFKLFKDPVKFVLFDETLIQGSTYTGKTSIPEAIAFCLTGKSLNGESQIDDIKNIDMPKGDIVVTVELLDEVSHTVKTITRIRGKKDEILIDGIKSSDTGLEAITGNPHLFLSIFNNRYFPGILPLEKQRSLIESITEQSNFEEIFAETANPDLIDQYSLEIYSPQEYKRIKKMIDEDTETFMSIRAEIEVLTKDNLDSSAPPIMPLDDSEDDLKEKYEKSLKVIDKQRELLQKVETSRQASSEIHILEGKLNQLDSVPANPTESMDDLNNIKQMAIRDINAQIEICQNQKIPTAAYPQKVSSGKCTTCQQDVSDEYATSYNLGVNNKIENIQKNNDALDEHIRLLRARIQEIETAYTNKVNSIQNTISSITYIRSQRSQLENQIEFLRKSLYFPDDKDKAIISFNMDAIRQAYEEVKTKNDQIRLQNQDSQRVLDRKQRNMSRIDDLNEQRTIVDQRLNDLKVIYDVIKPSNLYMKAIKKKIDTLKSFFINTSIKLYKENKTTEGGKDVFEIYYKQRPFRRLSYSESVLCGLEICNMLNGITELKIPIFIDNYESIQFIPPELKTGTQIIVARMQPNTVLSVNTTTL